MKNYNDTPTLVLAMLHIIFHVILEVIKIEIHIAKQPPLTKGKRLLQLYSWKGRPASSFFVIITYSNYFQQENQGVVIPLGNKNSGSSKTVESQRNFPDPIQAFPLTKA